MSDAPHMRSLIIGIESYTTMGRKRPGTNNALREINQRLQNGGWQTRLLTDDASSASLRSGLTQVLDGIEWLKASDQSLLIFSGLISDSRIYPCDAKASFVSQSTLSLPDLINALPKHAGMIIDGPVSTPLVSSLPWVIVAQDDHLQEEELFGSYGPTMFLHSITIALNTWPQDQSLKVKEFFEFVKRQDPPQSLYHNYSSLDSMTLLSAIDFVGTAPTLLTDLGDGSLSESSLGSSLGDMPHQNTPRGGRFIAKGRFQLQRILGEGGIGQVFLAKDTHLNKLRAVKLLKIPDTLSDTQRAHIQGRMIQSARAAQELSEHSHHVVQVYDLGIDEDSEMPFMVMEYLKGITLHERLYQSPSLTLEQIFEIGLTLCETLAIAHQQGVVHRDLKPDNIMLIKRKGSDLFLKLLDFDLVKVEEGEVKTQEGQILGTLEYMAPEQLKGMEIDARADVYALGAILYECFSGVRANPGKNQRELVRLLLDHGTKPLEEVAPHLPAELCALINRCLSLDMENRPADAQELLVDLKPMQRFQPALSRMSFGFSSISPSQSYTPDTLAPEGSESEELLYENETDTRIDSSAEASSSSQRGKSSAPQLPPTLITDTTLAPPLPAESTLVGNEIQSSQQQQRSILIGVGLCLIAGLALFFKMTPSDEPQESPKIPVKVTSHQENLSQTKTTSLQLKALESLRLLPSPTPDWSDEVKVSTEQVTELGEAHVYSGGRTEERLSHMTYELFFPWRAGDPPLNDWRESEELRYQLLSRLELNLLREAPGKLYVPQSLYIDLLRRRPSLEKAQSLGQVLVLSDGLLLVSDPHLESRQSSCKNLARGDLITKMSWVVRGKRNLNGQCEGNKCLDAHLSSLQRKRGSELRLTLSVNRAKKDRELWTQSKEVVKCQL